MVFKQIVLWPWSATCNGNSTDKFLAAAYNKEESNRKHIHVGYSWGEEKKALQNKDHTFASAVKKLSRKFVFFARKLSDMHKKLWHQTWPRAYGAKDKSCRDSDIALKLVEAL